MGGVLGVTAGSGFVRLVWLHESGSAGAEALDDRQSIVVDDRGPEELAADAVGMLLAGAGRSGSRVGVGIAYGDEAQAAAVDAALRRQGITNYRLIPELTAVLETLRHDDRVAGMRTVAVYDLGNSGLTVSVVDRSTGAVLATERSTALRGDRFRDVPRETPDDAVVDAIVESADLVGELVEQSGTVPEAVVLVGGGAHVPELRSVLQRHSAVPVLAASDPEFTAAVGAALLAEPGPRVRGRRSAPRAVSRRQLSGAALAGAALVVLAVVGVGLEYGRTFFGPQAGAAAESATTSSSVGVSSVSRTPEAQPRPTDTPVQPAADADLGRPPTVAGGRAAAPTAEAITVPRWPALEIPTLPPLPQLPGLPLPAELPSLPPLPALPVLPQL